MPSPSLGTLLPNYRKLINTEGPRKSDVLVLYLASFFGVFNVSVCGSFVFCVKRDMFLTKWVVHISLVGQQTGFDFLAQCLTCVVSKIIAVN
jgi:hypothetical protein